MKKKLASAAAALVLAVSGSLVAAPPALAAGQSTNVSWMCKFYYPFPMFWLNCTAPGGGGGW